MVSFALYRIKKIMVMHGHINGDWQHTTLNLKDFFLRVNARPRPRLISKDFLSLHGAK